MSYSLKQALLLSSQREAALDISPGRIAITYRLIVVAHDANDNGKNPCELKIHRVTYGKDGALTVAAEPHKTIPKDSLADLIDYLTEYGFAVDDAWSPVEIKEGTET